MRESQRVKGLRSKLSPKEFRVQNTNLQPRSLPLESRDASLPGATFAPRALRVSGSNGLGFRVGV